MSKPMVFDDALQETIKITKEAISNMILDKLYPIGSIYLETTNTNPSSKLGGTWEAYGESDTYLRLGGNGEGGSNKIATANLPSHSHTLTPSGSVSVKTNPTFTGTSKSYTSEINSVNHTHSMPSTDINLYYGESGSKYGAIASSVAYTNSNQKGTIYKAGFTYENTTGGVSANHTHSTTIKPEGSISGGAYTFSGSEGTTSSVGSGTDFEPKYVSVYAWKRIA